MRGKAWRVVAASVLAGLTIGLPGVGQAADEGAVKAELFADGPALANRLLRVEWVASSGHAGRLRLEGSVHNDYQRTALNVQLRIAEIDAAGQTVSIVAGPMLETVPGQSQVHFDVQVPDNRRSYQVAVTSYSSDFAERASSSIGADDGKGL